MKKQIRLCERVIAAYEENLMSSDERTRRIAEAYDEVVELFAKWTPSSQFSEIFEETVLELVRRYSDSFGKVRVLDVGCGHGTWIKYTLEKVGNTTNLHIKGFDISKERIRLAKSILAEYPNVTLEVEDAKRYSTPERYHIILFVEVFEHFTKPDYPVILQKYLNLLAEKGYLVIIDKEKYSFGALKIYIKRMLGLYYRALDFSHYPLFRYLLKISRENGSKIMDRKKVGVFRGLVLQRPSD